MADIIEEKEHQFGKLVALEGDEEYISTQLRLLPPSQKILIIPSLADDLPQSKDKRIFDARAYVRDVYSTFVDRTETARTFLKSSTSAHPRLVFVNGGSVCARTTCITAICDNLTNGDVGEAETLFNGIVQDGVAGLMEEDEVADEVVQTDGTDGDYNTEQVVERVEDPTIQAMKAADYLDRETAVLQSDDGISQEYEHGHENYAGDDTEVVPIVHERVDEPDQELHDHNDASNIENDPKSMEPQEDDNIVRTVVTVRSRILSAKARNTPRSNYTFQSNYNATLNHQAPTDDEDENDDGRVSPGDDTYMSLPPTPGVIIGEACIVNMQTVSPISELKGARRVKSAEEIYQGHSDFPALSGNKAAHLRHTVSAFDLSTRRANADAFIDDPEESFPTLSSKTFVRSTTIRKASIAKSTSTSTSRRQQRTSRTFVDRGTDTEVFVSELPVEVPYEPVFPVVEDLIIHFNDTESREILESVIRSYKNESYPKFPSQPEADLQTPQSPRSISSQEQDERLYRKTSHYTAETDDYSHDRRQSFDPYSTEEPAIPQRWSSRDKARRVGSGIPAHEPPTPAMTPPPQPMTKTAEKFVSFSRLSIGNAITVHNLFRELLSTHFPVCDGYSQHYYSSSPETERLWKPVFKNENSSDAGNESQSVDQIIALGCEAGVKKDFFNQISGHIERLGTKRDGINKSAKVNIDYLIANVMQSFSGLPLTLQSTFNPLSNPTLLATLLVPQLETYLASNTSTRLLILQYSSANLATVLALRQLLGTDLFRVAGVLDSLASDPPSILSHPRKTSNSNPLSNDAVNSRSKNRPPLSQTRVASEKPFNSKELHRASMTSIASSARSSIALPRADTSASFSKADHLLPSTATDTEITTFLSGIWKSLMEKSIFYTPEPEPEPIVIEKIIQAPPIPTLPTPIPSPIYPPSSFRPSGNQSKISRLTGSVKHSYTPSVASTKHGRAASSASIKTSRTERSRQETKAWENFYIGEEDSEDDEYDKMILGRGFAKIRPETPKKPGQGQTIRPKKKALKWLGLA